ncbi:MAG: RNA-binding S4 domain-containing protein [Hyphomicrobium sp.]|uniref:RNA-binding S4 domain-containing protein n=1 Tax=Hyphomicrobium sp. TaxID=82 RepID=UPI0039E23E8C
MKAPGRPDTVPESDRALLQRIDQWLWFARIAKSRTLAQALIERGKVRVNRVKIEKASLNVRAGDVLTLSLGPRVISIEVLGIGARRGPASEAQLLYRDLTPKPQKPASGVSALEGEIAFSGRPAARLEGSGRPTKRDRRATDKLRGRDEL